MASKLHKTAKGRHELATGIRTLSQPERTLLVLSDGHKSVQDFQRQLGPIAAKIAQDLIQRGYLEAKVDTIAATVPAPLMGAVTAPLRLVEAPVPSLANVLVVDDSEVALQAMQRQLRGFRATVHFADSGETALSLVPKYDFHIVFLDVMMAGLDGYQTCRAIKHYKSRSGHVPAVVMQTSRGGVFDRIRGTMARCDAYLTKPLHQGELLAVMQQFAPAAVAASPHPT